MLPVQPFCFLINRSSPTHLSADALLDMAE